VRDEPPPPTPEGAAPDEGLSLPQAVRALFEDLPGVVSDRVRLLALELQRASRALGRIVALALLAAILFATAWTAFWCGIAGGLIAAGLAWPWVALAVLSVNFLAAVWAVTRVKALAPLLALPATLRRLTDADDREHRDEIRRAVHAEAEAAAVAAAAVAAVMPEGAPDAP
jgi:hypothetical protein